MCIDSFNNLSLYLFVLILSLFMKKLSGIPCLCTHTWPTKRILYFFKMPTSISFIINCDRTYFLTLCKYSLLIG